MNLFVVNVLVKNNIPLGFDFTRILVVLDVVCREYHVGAYDSGVANEMMLGAFVFRLVKSEVPKALRRGVGRRFETEVGYRIRRRRLCCGFGRLNCLCA